MLKTLQMSFKPWFQMHSVRKYPIDLTADWTLKQKYPPHIVFWGGGLPFRHPYQFYITFVSKMHFLPQIQDFIIQKHSKFISKPNDARSFHFLKIFLNAKIFLGGRVRSGYRFFGNLTGEVGPENFHSQKLQLDWKGIDLYWTLDSWFAKVGTFVKIKVHDFVNHG